MRSRSALTITPGPERDAHRGPRGQRHLVLDLGASSTEPVRLPRLCAQVSQAVAPTSSRPACSSVAAAWEPPWRQHRSAGSRPLPARTPRPPSRVASTHGECPLPVRDNAGRRRCDRNHARLDRCEVFRGGGPRAPGRQAHPARVRPVQERAAAPPPSPARRSERPRAPRGGDPACYPPQRHPLQRHPASRRLFPPHRHARG